MRSATELGLHADDEIEQLFPLNDLRDRLPPDCSLNEAHYVRDIDPISCNLVAINIDQKAGLAKFAHHGKLSEPRHTAECVLNLDGFILQYVQVLTIDL